MIRCVRRSPSSTATACSRTDSTTAGRLSGCRRRAYAWSSEAEKQLAADRARRGARVAGRGRADPAREPPLAAGALRAGRCSGPRPGERADRPARRGPQPATSASRPGGWRGRSRRSRLVFILASLREPERDVASFLSGVASQHPRRLIDELRAALSPRTRRFMSVRELERARAAAELAHARIADFLDVRPARLVELQWLIRRGFCRGLGEPEVDGLHEPRALAFECNGQAVLAPLEGDVMRWADGLVEHRGRSLRSRVRAGPQLAGTAGARRPARAGGLSRRAGRADVRAGRRPAVRGRHLAERPLPAERARRQDRASPRPGRRPDRARGVRRRAGCLRPRLRAHPGGEGPAVLSAGRESPAAAAGDARARGRRRQRGRARAPRGDVPPRLRRGSPASAARRPAAAVPAAPSRSADEARRLRRHAARPSRWRR